MVFHLAAQALVRSYNLELREVSPLKEGRQSSEKLFLILEGEMQDFMRFLHGLATSGSASYPDGFDITLGDQNNRVRIEMTLAQF